MKPTENAVADEYVRHLDTIMRDLARLPWRSTHEPTGYPVWFMIALVADARERVESGREG